MTSFTDTGRRRAAPVLGTFERYLTVWVALCIIAGIMLVSAVLPLVARVLARRRGDIVEVAAGSPGAAR